MAMSHENASHEFLARLRERAEAIQESGASALTTGYPDESPLASWKGENGVVCTHLPDEEQGILRISIGGGEHLPVTMNYCNIRGSVGQCIDLLEKAIAALKECPE